MTTPICDFVKRYANSEPLRLHMPGHKGEVCLGAEPYDITEIDGADSLYEASGIIRESEQNASALFGCETLYSTEGSSQCIRAMVYLVALSARERGHRPLLFAARNAHKAFLSAVALCDAEVQWIGQSTASSYLSCGMDADTLENALRTAAVLPDAVYITSPDYLGEMADVAALAEICTRYGVWLLVDNAHGAYLRFLPKTLHPIDLGAHLSCDSAHKTLPVLTGGAYLHLSPSLPSALAAQAKDALALFGSTSPSYLILQSLDLANPYLETLAKRLQAFLPSADALRDALRRHGYTLYGDEPLKITLQTKPFGYTGREIAAHLQQAGIYPEFADPDFAVLMLSPTLTQADLDRVRDALCALPRKEALTDRAPMPQKPTQVMTVRQATFSPSETVDAGNAVGRILAASTVGCPPAVPPVMCGERIDEHTASILAYYGITTLQVVKE